MATEPTKRSLGSNLPSVQYPLLINVLQSMAEGETEARACEIWNMSMTTFRYHLKRDEELQEMYAEAVKIGNDALADMLINIDKVHSAPAMASVISRNIQWLLERRNPDKYGARVTLTNDNRATMAVIEALNKAVDRIPGASAPVIQAQRTITDVEFVPVDPLPPGTQKPAPFAGAPAGDVQGSDYELLRQLGLLD